MNKVLLCHAFFDEGYPEQFEKAGFTLYYATTPAERANIAPQLAQQVHAVLTYGSIGLNADEIENMPNLEIICSQGVGYEQIDLDAAAKRGIVVTYGPGTNSCAVADHTLALMLGITRLIPQLDVSVRERRWSHAGMNVVEMTGKKLGVLGLGDIGNEIAQRCADGFKMPVAYHNRNPRKNSPWRYFDSIEALAEWADYLVVATPGGKETAKLVDANVLRALGSRGFLINIARGSVVDSGALIASLKNKEIAGAALDVIEGEPVVPEAFLPLSNLVLTPHIGGRSPEAMQNMMSLVLQNLTAHFSGQPVITPVTR
ncbi:2-hydroxyacid dehydrogenase [Ewingella americana]|uniref:2-hydroxyacid dehydrogenase n=1 Tax=Ewingella americana TaxID=41202 RepID=UPI001639F6C3|nr:2-hydroxyacid dehydrogenase [Ewingella americana]QMV54016.1 2-hydroxyacid dehydrogenase [Ewingella americana]